MRTLLRPKHQLRTCRTGARGADTQLAIAAAASGHQQQLQATHCSTMAFSLLGSAPRISSTFSPLKYAWKVGMAVTPHSCATSCSTQCSCCCYLNSSMLHGDRTGPATAHQLLGGRCLGQVLMLAMHGVSVDLGSSEHQASACNGFATSWKP